ncbi:hypothetical protein acdb102_44230 [Acidothermaceae bacterium B102]|nr:hypothetical protein acdb102_44230 [Acidothermaceae bacterium B102]
MRESQRWIRAAAALGVACGLVGTGAPALATPRAPTTPLITAAASSSTSLAGTVVTISGTATGIKARTGLTLLSLRSGHWRTLAHAHVAASGHYSLQFSTPRAAGRLSLRVVGTEADKNVTARSSVVHVQVVHRGFAVHSAASHDVPANQPILVAGTVTPATTGHVTLERQLNGRWTALASAPLLHSSFNLATQQPPGQYLLRVSKAMTNTLASGSSAPFSVTVDQPTFSAPTPPGPVSVQTGALPRGSIRAHYSATLTAAGGVPPYNWAITAGALPPGLALSADGSISGTPTRVGSARLDLTATDAQGHFAVRTLSVAVANPGGALQVWGSNFFGALGDGIGTADQLPHQVQGLGHVTQVAQYSGTRYALTATGSVLAWGQGGSGQLGNGSAVDSATPVQVTGLTSGVLSLAAGPSNGYALKADGTVWAWGTGSDGQLGNGSHANSLVPVEVPHLSSVVAIAGEGLAALALRSDGTVWTWGVQWRSDDGDGRISTGPHSLVPVRVAGLSSARVTAIAGGDGTGYALMANHSVRAWGAGWNGELGNGDPATTTVAAIPVTGLTSNVAAMTAGIENGYALKTDGTVWSWGLALDGELGDGDVGKLMSAVPVQVVGLDAAVAISAGGRSAYARLTDGTVRGWGNNGQGQMGNGTSSTDDARTNAFAPVVVSLSNVESLAGDAVAASADGSVWQWGSDVFAERDRARPGPVAGLTDVTAVGVGYDGGVAAKTDGTVWTWGENLFGPRGSAAHDHFDKATPVPGLTDVINVAATSQDYFAMKADGTLWGWGDNYSSELGVAGFNPPAPVKIPGLTDVVAVAGSVALKADGTLWTLGATSVQVAGLPQITSIAAGTATVFATAADGTVWAWGRNTYGQLGDGSTIDSPAPEKVPALTGVTSIASGDSSSYGVRDGKVLAWGDNFEGELGQGTASVSWSAVPVVVPGVNDAVAVAAGGFAGYALLGSGAVMGWGLGGAGALGTNPFQLTAAATLVPGLTGVTTLNAQNQDIAALQTP